MKIAIIFDSIISRIDNLESIKSSLSKLGKDHIPFKVKPIHFTAFGTALIRTLEDKLGRDFDTDARQAWELAYLHIQDGMVDHIEDEDFDPDRGLTVIPEQANEAENRSTFRDDSMRGLMES